MKIECTRRAIAFHGVGSRELAGRFDGGKITSDGGGLWLRKLEAKLGLMARFTAGFSDQCDPKRIEHMVEELVAQRVYGLALGYEDLNDHDHLRSDPVRALSAPAKYCFSFWPGVSISFCRPGSIQSGPISGLRWMSTSSTYSTTSSSGAS